jgi:hypothetical protein
MKTLPRPQSVSVSIAVMPGACWRCGSGVLPIVGVFASGESRRRWFDFGQVAARLAATIDVTQLAALGIGPIKMRTSRSRPRGYLANGCIHCDAILGDHPLREDLTTFLSEGGELEELIAATVILPSRTAPRRHLADA